MVENKPGAGSTHRVRSTVAKAPKDGYTALDDQRRPHGVGGDVQGLPYDSVKDFAPVGHGRANSAFVIVARKDFPANDVKGLIALAKARRASSISPASASARPSISPANCLRQIAGIDVKHIPYRGTPARGDGVAAREVDYAVELVHAVHGQVQAGELKLLAVGAPERWPTLPDVPTVAESGVPGYYGDGWYGLVFPAGTPASDRRQDERGAARRCWRARRSASDSPRSAPRVMSTARPNSASISQHEVAKWQTVREKAGLNIAGGTLTPADVERG